MADDGEECWFCNGLNSDACAVCGVAAEPENPDTAIRKETEGVHGQDGWCLPGENNGGRAQKKTLETPEEYNFKILEESEQTLRSGDADAAEKALLLARRAERNMRKHLKAANADGVAPMWRKYEKDLRKDMGAPDEPAVAPVLQRGERELAPISYAQVIRCLILKQEYKEAVEECKWFTHFYKQVVKSGNPVKLHKQERQLLEPYVDNSSCTFLGHMETLKDSLEVALLCRERVGQGHAPKLVLDNTRKAIDALDPVSVVAVPGLDTLRAHLHVTRAHAALELERWDVAKEDAELALAYDPRFSEAEYMRQSAEAKEW